MFPLVFGYRNDSLKTVEKSTMFFEIVMSKLTLDRVEDFYRIL
jgi:hypothetical protein